MHSEQPPTVLHRMQFGTADEQRAQAPIGDIGLIILPYVAIHIQAPEETVVKSVESQSKQKDRLVASQVRH